MHRYRYESGKHAGKAFVTIDEMRHADELCDVNLLVMLNNQVVRTIRSHRVVLASCSEYFRRMFTSGMQEASMRTLLEACASFISVLIAQATFLSTMLTPTL